MTIQTASFPGIELVRVGTWNGRNGEATITEDDLADAVAAYQDQEVDRGRLRFGHSSSLNAELGDGAPAYGWLENLKLSDDRRSLIGDLVDIPKQLAGLIGRAYRQRSVELRRNVVTPSGKTYRAALTGLALLGASAPAVKGMEDIVALYASENPDGIDDEARHDSIVAVELSGDLIPTHHGERWDTGGEDPGKARGDDQEEPDMAYPKSTLDALGLPEGATEEQVNAAIAARAAQTQAPDPAAAPQAQAADPAPQQQAEGQTPAPEAPAADTALSAPETVTVSKAVWEDTRTRLNRLEVDAAARRRAEVLDTALTAGRIVPAERAKWEVALSAAPEATETLLAQLPARVNTVEAGADTALSAGEDVEEIAAQMRKTMGLDL